MSGRVWLRWPQVGRCVRGRDGDLDPMSLTAQAPLGAAGERLPAEAATAQYGGAGEDGAVGRRRLGRCWTASILAGCWRWCPDACSGWGVGLVSDRAPAKAETHLKVALTHLDQAARHVREAGLARQAGTLERPARDAAEVLGRLQPARRPTLPVDQAADA